MTVKYRKAFFSDLANINQLELIKDIEFITESANIAKNPLEVPGLKWLRQYPGMARIEVAPFRIGVEVISDTIIFIRVLHRSVFYLQFP
jgi:mRNA-degrading endonuclease RelE of RelBE toxin-antitoxin system